MACEVRKRTTGAILAAERFAGTQLGRGRDKFLDVLPGILPPTAARYAAFDMGSAVGVLESLVDIVYGTIEGIRAIPKLTRMMLLAVDYKMHTARTHREVGVAAGLEGALAVMPGLRLFALRATLEEEKQAYEQVRAIKREVQAIVGEGWDLTQEGARDAQELWVFIWNSPQGAMRDGRKLGREGLAEARRILAEAEKTISEPDLHKQYANGERYGKVVGETVLNILLIVSMVGDIAEVARAVGAGAKVGADLAKEAAELARLERATQGTTRLASAIRGLRTALEEWRAARAAARMTAELEAKLLADAKKLEKLSTDVGKTVEKQAGGLSKEAGELERAKGKHRSNGERGDSTPESGRDTSGKTPQDTAPVSRVATKPNEAFFWSGRTNGIGGEKIAGKYAKSMGGITLEELIESRGVKMPDFDPSNPLSVQAWKDLSAEYANGASGTVRAVVGKSLRDGNVWETSELPALKSNLNVTEIIKIDPESGVEEIIFRR